MGLLLLLIGAWAGSAASGGVASHFGRPQILTLALTLVCLAALWRLAVRHHLELRKRREACVAIFPASSRCATPRPESDASRSAVRLLRFPGRDES